MKKLFILIFTCLTWLGYSQSNKIGKISGKVIDKTSKEALPYVNIIVKNATGKIITGDITNELGSFNISKIPLGKNNIEIQFMGFKTSKKQVNITSKNRTINLGTILLEEASNTLEEVEIRAETSSVVQKVDRKVINVGKDLTSAGTSASELLNNVPSVSVDAQSGNISLRGNENVRVLIDGKPSNIPASEVLKQIPSSSIKSVELITNPSAKYNPEGMSGIINIILNKNANIGFNAAVNAGVTFGHYTRYNTSINANYKTGKVNFFGNYGLNTGERYNFGFFDRPLQNYGQKLNFSTKYTTHLAKIGADIYLDDKNTISLYTNQNWSDSNLKGNATERYNNSIVNIGNNKQAKERHTQAYNANYKHDFSKGHNIEFEANYSLSDNENFIVNSNELTTNSTINTDILTDRKNILLNLDYTTPLSEDSKLEIGAEYRQNQTKSDNTVSTFTNNNKTAFDYSRDIISGYFNYNKKLGKLGIQLGARFEQFNVDGDFFQNEIKRNITDDIFSIYPSAFLTFNATEKDQFQLSYSRRVDRPSIRQVSPIAQWSLSSITSIGNPDLVPQFTNSLEFNFSHQFKGGSFSLGSFYRQINDVISRVSYIDPKDIEQRDQILSFANYKNSNSYGLEFSTNYRIAKWWRINASADVFSQKQLGTVDITNPEAKQIEVTNTSFNSRISNSFVLSKKLRLQLFAMYRSPFKDIQWDAKQMWMINAGANYSVLKGKGNITLRANDIFKGMKFAYSTTNPFIQQGEFNWESQSIYLGFNYRFGSGKNRAKRRRNRDNNEKKGSGML